MTEESIPASNTTSPAPATSVPTITAGSEWRRPTIAPESPPFMPMILHGYLRLLATFGVYRFWLNRDTRRWYREHILLEGDRFEYLGTAREHLRGFLKGMLFAVPLNLTLFFGTVVLGTYYGMIAVWLAIFAINY